MSTTIHPSRTNLPLTTTDPCIIFKEPSPHDCQYSLSTAIECYFGSSTQSPSLQEIGRMRESMSNIGEETGYIDGAFDTTAQRSTSMDSGTPSIPQAKALPASASATSTLTRYPHSSTLPTPSTLVALRDDTNSSSSPFQLQEPDAHNTPTTQPLSFSSTFPAQLPEFSPFSPVFNIGFHHSQFRLDSPISPPRTTASQPTDASPQCLPQSPSRVSFAQPPKEAIPHAVAPPRRSSLYIGTLRSSSSPTSSLFSQHSVPSSNNASTISIGSGSGSGSVTSLPVSPLTPSIPITPPPEELARRRMDKIERTFGVAGVGALAIGSGSRGGDLGKRSESGTVKGQGNDRQPFKADTLTSPIERARVAPWDALSPAHAFAKPKSLTRKLTKSKPPTSHQPQPENESHLDPKSKVRRIPAPIVVIPPSNSPRPSQHTITSDVEPVQSGSQAQKEADLRSQESGGAAIRSLGSTPDVSVPMSPSHSPAQLVPLSSYSRYSSSPSSCTSDEVRLPYRESIPRSRATSLSSVSHAYPASPVGVARSPRSPHSARSPPTMKHQSEEREAVTRGRAKDFGTRRRSRSVSHISNQHHDGSSRRLNLNHDLIPPVPSTPLTPNSSRQANLTKTLHSLDANLHKSDKKAEVKMDESAKAKARRRKNMDSLGYPLSPSSTSLPSQSSLTSQRYVKPAARNQLTISPSGSTTTLAGSVSSTSASTSSRTLNLPLQLPPLPAIPSIHISRQDLGFHKGLKRSTSFSLLRMGKGKRDDTDGHHERDKGKEKESKSFTDAADEWRAQLQRSEREVLAGFKTQSQTQALGQSSLHSQPRSSTSTIHPASQPTSRSTSRAPSRQPSKSNINLEFSNPSPYLSPARVERSLPAHTQERGQMPFLATPSSTPPQKEEFHYGRVDNRVCGAGWSGEWNLPLEEVIHRLRMIQSP